MVSARARSAIEMGCLAGVEARDQVAIELQVSFVMLLRLYSAHRCAAGTYPIRKAETVDSALVDRIGPNDGDAKLTSRFSTPNLISNFVISNFLIDRGNRIFLFGIVFLNQV